MQVEVNNDNSINNNYCQIELSYKEIIFIKVWNCDSFENPLITLNITCVCHIHEYSYKPVDRYFHILKCHCGETSGSHTLHTIDNNNENLIFMQCVFCGLAIRNSDNDFYPVVGLNNKKNELSKT